MTATTEPKRTIRVREYLATMIRGLAATPEEERRERPELESEAASLLMDLCGDNAPREAALVLLAYCIVEGRPLNLIDQAAGDLKPDVPRLDGDRTVSERLSQDVLHPLGIPATKGVFQSSTYRSGYSVKHANNGSVKTLVEWISEPTRSLDEVQALFDSIALLVASEAFIVPDLPPLDRRAFTFPAFSQLLSKLIRTESQGAMQQYTFAALLTEYVEATYKGRVKVTTKPIFQSDASAGTLGDVEIRAGMNLQSAFEVSASNWRVKIQQAIDAVTTQDEITSITILAAEPPSAGLEILEAIDEHQLPSGISGADLDIAVLGLLDECNSLAAKLEVRERTGSVQRLYDYLVRFCKSQPDLVAVLIAGLQDLELTDEHER